MTTLLDKFGLDADLFSALADAPEVFESSGRTTTLHAGRRIPFKASIPGKDANGNKIHTEVTAYATLLEASLTRMSILKQTSVYTGDEYKIVTGIFKPVKMNLEVMIDGEAFPLHEFLRRNVNEGANKPIDEQTFLDTASRIGLKFVEGMPLFWQQFGASETGIDHAFEAFKAAGATDVTSILKKTESSNITTAFSHADGVPVTSFEVGTVDREKSSTGQGFLNLIDASVDQFTRIVGLRKQASLLKAEVANQTNWKQEKILQAEDRIKLLDNMSRQWRTNWAGAQQIIRKGDGGSLVPEDQYAAVNAPCGRFSMVIDNQSVAVDLWKNSARAESTNNDASKVVSMGEELPF